MDGFLILDKPSGPTSHDMVNMVRRGTGQKRVGHAGTLDPLATGVLVLCLGAATRLSEYLLGESKRYLGTVRLGVETDTYDAQGTVTEIRPVTVGRAEVEAALQQFRGQVQQRPPAFSAVKRGGRKAYELARRGEALELEPRTVTFYNLALEDWQPPDLQLDVHCSAGTYIRSLAHDLGQALGCGAHLAALRRTASGHFDVSQAVPVDELSAGFTDGTWTRHLLPPAKALGHWPALQVDAAGVERLLHGQTVTESDDKPASESARLALALAPDGSLIAIVEHDPVANHWRPRKVLTPNP